MFSSTSPVVYQSQEIILQNGYIIEMGTGHQCADSNYPNGFEYWYSRYYDGNASWHNEFHHTISGSAQHTFYIFETTSTNCGDSHCWQIQIDSTHEGDFGVVQTGTSPLVWIAPTSSSSSIHSSYQVSQMAYTDGYGGWNNFSGTGFNAGGTTLCVYNYSDTKMNVADNPSDWTNCT
jgi:hypothetical protein